MYDFYVDLRYWGVCKCRVTEYFSHNFKNFPFHKIRHNILVLFIVETLHATSLP